MKANATNGTSDARALGESEPEVHLRKRYASFGFVFCVALWSVTDTAYAKNCSSSGSLAYIGRTNDSSSSVWLSTIGEGASSSFRLEAAQGTTTVDAFGPTTPGDAFRHLSLSPFVSNGSGGTHKLYDSTSGDCLLDTQNQKGGIVFPPFPSRPPVGIRPPIAILPPPGGLMPTLPGRVSPPIGTLPPTGLMPTFPAGVRPPIAILPPTGVKPGLPGGVSPPIGTLPPGGLVPTLPGRVSPPIAILPPTGVKPGLPGGVSPPIGTLPPGGGSGGAGGGSGGGGSSGGGGAVAGQVTATTNAGASPRQSLGGAASCTADQRRYPDLPYCDPDERYLGSAGGAPLTTGRDFAPPTPWNVWIDTSFVQTDDDRFAIGLSGNTISTGGGVDYALSATSIVGFQLLSNRTESNSPSDSYSLNSEGVSFGPYAAISLNDQWALYGSLTWGSYDTDVGLLTLSGDYDQDQFAADIILTGQYVYNDGSYLRPQFSMSYLRLDNPDYQLSGSVSGTPVSIDIAGGSSTYGTFNPSVEFGQIYQSGRTLWVPYGEIGAIYEFSRPESLGLFGTEETSEWSGTIRAGVRMNTKGAFHAELSVGYLSAFQANLDVVEAELYLAWGF